jgi:hypothetical protein
MPSDEKEVTVYKTETDDASTTSTKRKTRRRRPHATKQKQTHIVEKEAGIEPIVGKAVFKAESISITKQGSEPAHGIKKTSEQVIVLPKSAKPKIITNIQTITPIGPPAPAPTKVKILPKIPIMKLKIAPKRGITAKVPTKPLALATKSTKITLQKSPKTRKQYKERKLKIDF